MGAILCGVPTSDQEPLHESELKGISKSNVSRLWQLRATCLASELVCRDLSGEPILCLILDGVDNLYVLVGIEIYADRHSEVLGFRIGKSENLEVSRDFVADLVIPALKLAES